MRELIIEKFEQPTEIVIDPDFGKTMLWKNKNGQLHREEGLPAVIHEGGKKLWYKNGVQYKSNFDTYEKMCKLLSVSKEDKLLETDNSYVSAHKKLVHIAKVLNQGWKPDWGNSNEYKWYPYFDLSAGCCFHAVFYYYTLSSYVGGSRLCFRTETVAQYAGKQFESIYKDFLT